MTDSTHGWLVYVDETGAMAAPEDTNAVVALVLGERDGAAFEAEIRPRLRDLFWPCDDPAHATELRFPSARLAALLARGWTEEDAANPVRRSLVALAERLSTVRHPALEALRSLPAQRDARRNALARADAWLALCRRADWNTLRAFAECQTLGLQEELQRLADRYPGRSFVAAAGTDAVPWTRPADLYLGLLEVALERIAMTIAPGDGPRCDVQLWVAARPGLRRRDVCAALERARKLAPRVGRTLRWRVHRPRSANHASESLAGLILADQIANRMYGVLQQATRLRDCVAMARDRFVWDLRVVVGPLGERPLPSLAADGPAREALHEGVAGRPAGVLTRAGRLWARSQAEPWLSVASSFEVGRVSRLSEPCGGQP